MIQFNSASGVAGPGQLPNGKPNSVLPDNASARAQAQVQENSNAKSARESDSSVNLSNSVQSKYDSPEQVLKNFDPQAVVDNVSSVLEQAIKRAAANGASPEELEKMQASAQKGIDKGFAEAQDIIKGLGLMSDELGAVISEAREGLRDRLESFTGQLVEGTVVAGTQSTTMSAAAKSENSFSFSVTTAEGDTVTINAARSQSSRMDMVTDQADGARKMMTEWQDARSDSFRFTIEGDLNDEELEAIEAMMKKVGQVADKFFGGQYEAAFEKAQRLELGSDALVSMSMNMTQKTAALAEYSAVSSGEGGRSRANADWLLPIKQYAQGLGELQRSQSSVLNSDTWLDMLSAHPKQKANMIDFADTLMRRNQG